MKNYFIFQLYVLLFGKLPQHIPNNNKRESQYSPFDSRNDIDPTVIVSDPIISSFSQLEHLYDLLEYLEKHKNKLKYVWRLIEKMFDSQSNVTFSDEEINAVAEELKVSVFYSFFL